MLNLVVIVKRGVGHDAPNRAISNETRSSAVAETPRDASSH